MRVLVCGSRIWKDGSLLVSVLDGLADQLPDGETLTVVHGDCKSGADAQADRWASLRGVEVERHPAEWDRYGRAAGPIRNLAMVETRPDLVIAFLRGPSVGTSTTIRMAEEAGLTVRKWEAPA